MTDRDPGDEDDGRPPVQNVVEEWLDSLLIPTVSRDVFDFIDYAESMRSCCRDCALDANGEDGS